MPIHQPVHLACSTIDSSVAYFIPSTQPAKQCTLRFSSPLGCAFGEHGEQEAETKVKYATIMQIKNASRGKPGRQQPKWLHNEEDQDGRSAYHKKALAACAAFYWIERPWPMKKDGQCPAES